MLRVFSVFALGTSVPFIRGRRKSVAEDDGFTNGMEVPKRVSCLSFGSAHVLAVLLNYVTGDGLLPDTCGPEFTHTFTVIF